MVVGCGSTLSLEVEIRTLLATAAIILVVALPLYVVPVAGFHGNLFQAYAQQIAPTIQPADQVLIRGAFNGTFNGQLNGAVDDSGKFRGKINGDISGEIFTTQNNTRITFKTNGTFSGRIVDSIINQALLKGTIEGNYLGPVNGTIREGIAHAAIMLTLKGRNYESVNASGEFNGRYEFLYQRNVTPTTYTDPKEIFFGGSLTKDDRLIMRVKATSPAFLRGGVYDTYSGAGWTRSDLVRHSVDQSQLLAPLRSAENKKFIEAKIQIANRSSTVLFTPAVPVKIAANGLILTLLTIDNYNTIREEGNSSFIGYSVISYVPTLDPVALRRVRVASPYSEAGPQYLQIPEMLPQRVWDLARKVTLNATNNYDLAKSLESYLRSSGEYSYTLKVPYTPSGADAADYFLFESKEGHSLHFASAMVMMSRTLGIASRLVAGYGPAGFANSTGTYDVKRSDIHFVPELYFGAQAGWIPFEPTPGGSAKPEFFEFHKLPTYPNVLATETSALGRETLFRLNSTLELSILPMSGGARIESKLSDELKRPIPGANVVVEVDQNPLAVFQTGSDGRLSKDLQLPSGAHFIRLVYLGAPSFEGTETNENFVVPPSEPSFQVSPVSSGAPPILEASIAGSGIVIVAITLFLRRKRSRRKLIVTSTRFAPSHRKQLLNEALAKNDPRLRLLAVYALLKEAAANRFLDILPSLTPKEFASVLSERLPDARPFLERATEAVERSLYTKGSTDITTFAEALEDLLAALRFLDGELVTAPK